VDGAFGPKECGRAGYTMSSCGYLLKSRAFDCEIFLVIAAYGSSNISVFVVQASFA